MTAARIARRGWWGLAAALLFSTMAACAARTATPPSTAGAATCDEKTPAPCEAACFGGSGPACAIIGEALSGMADAPVRLPQDRPRGRRALDHGCRLGDLSACRILIDYDADDEAGASGCAGWESVCNRGDLRSCAFLGQCLLYDNNYRREPPRALRLFEEGCARGERVACRELGYIHSNGKLVPKDRPKAYALLSRACQLDDQAACVGTAEMLDWVDGVPRDIEKAKALYRTACARGIRPRPCEALRRLGEEPPSSTVSSGGSGASESRFESETYSYGWRIPANWQFVSPATLGWTAAVFGEEIVGARARAGGATESLTIAVTDDIELGFEDYELAGPDLAALDRFQADAEESMKAAGFIKTGSSRTSFFGQKAARVDGKAASPRTGLLTMLVFRKDRRRFELRCLTSVPQRGMVCREAFGSLEFHDMPPMDADAREPRDLHVRDDRLGVSFDPPDGLWYGVGPRLAASGAQAVWTWKFSDRRIDLSAQDLLSALRALDAEKLATQLADDHRKHGAKVAVDASELAGQRGVHVAIDRPNLRPQDLYFIRRGDVLFVLSVTAKARDAALLQRVRSGLRFPAPRP